MNHREYSKSEIDPVTGRDDHDLFFLPEDERIAVIKNKLPESISKKERERELEERLASFSVLSILNEAIRKAELLVNNTESRVVDQKDIHDAYSLLGTAKSWEAYFKSKGFNGNFLELKFKDGDGYQYILNLLIDLNY